VATDPDVWVYALALTRGMRRGEIAGLQWSDIDLDAGTLRVQRARITVGGEAQTSNPKAAASRRLVPLDPALVAMLRSHRAHQAADRLAAGSAWDSTGWLWADAYGGPQYPDAISARFDRLVRAAGVRRLSFHSTRHCCATLLLAAGTPLRETADLLGHSPAVCLATYSHSVKGLGQTAAARLSTSLLGGAGA
jgi:integrase